MKGFIGGGKMAEAMIKGLTKGAIGTIEGASGTIEGASGTIIVSDPAAERRSLLEARYGVRTTADNAEVVKEADIIVLAVKPRQMDEVLGEVGGLIREEQTVVSIAAGVTTDYLKKKVGSRKIVRAMPNTPALAGQGMTVLSLADCYPDRDFAHVRDLFMSIGQVLVLPEAKMDAVTAVSGSGPAFVALFVEAMAAGGVSAGLSKDEARTLSTQTLIGTAALLEDGMPPGELREMVTSRGGTTAEGLKAFQKRGFNEIVAEAIMAAASRSRELGRN